MQFDPNALKMLLAQSDEDLWKLIRRIAESNGIKIASSPPPAEEMKELRALLSGAEHTDYQKALSLIANHRKREPS